MFNDNHIILYSIWFVNGESHEMKKVQWVKTDRLLSRRSSEAPLCGHWTRGRPLAVVSDMAPWSDWTNPFSPSIVLFFNTQRLVEQ